MKEFGFKPTAVPFGGRTDARYASDLLTTFLKLRRRVRLPSSLDIVTEGRFRSAGWLSGWLHHAPVFSLTVFGSILGSEHKKLM